jgi:hypothetical protein
MLVACKWEPRCVWIGLICGYTLLSSKETTKISYEEWRALWMDKVLLTMDLVQCYEHLALLALMIIAVRILFR